MSWNDILAHDDVVERFRKSVEYGRLASTYLFVGKKGVGKRTFALKLAECLLCEVNSESLLEPCGTCPACQQVRSETHPDLILISKPPEKNFIPVETFIGDREHRRQVGLCHDIGLKPFRGGCKIAIIDDADFLNQESANSLLKTLEEPPPKSVLILIGTSAQRQLPTILSRSQVIRFGELTPSQIETLLERFELPNEMDPRELALAADGSIDLAVQLGDPDTMEYRSHLFQQLASADPASDKFSATTVSFVESVGKDAARKRKQLRLVTYLAIQYYRALMSAQAEETSFDTALQSAINNHSFPIDDSLPIGAQANALCQIASKCVSRTIDAQWHISANAQPINIINSWLVDLGRISRGAFTPHLTKH